MRVLVTRPHEDSQRLIPILAARGIEVVMAPLLDIVYEQGPALNLAGVQAVLFTSANGVRAFSHRAKDRALPVLCVGDASRIEALAAGFTDVKSANGDVQALADLVKAEVNPDGGVLLHPAGTNVAGDLAGQVQAAGFTYRREALYRAQKMKTFPAGASRALAAGQVEGVLLYSPRTAAVFAGLVQDAGLESVLARMTAYCLSASVADKLSSLQWATVKIAAQPHQDALLVLL